MKLNKLILGAVAAAALLPAAAGAQTYYTQYGNGSYAYAQQAPYGYGRSDSITDRTERVRDRIRRGTEEGWLRGWQSRRAWQELRAVREMADNGYDRSEAWRRLNALNDFLRDARDRAY